MRSVTPSGSWTAISTDSSKPTWQIAPERRRIERASIGESGPLRLWHTDKSVCATGGLRCKAIPARGSYNAGSPMKIAFWTPLPPTKSGIAHYSSMLLPGLAGLHDVTAVVATEEDVAAFQSSDGGRAQFRVIAADEGLATEVEFDLAIYQLGNNPHHEFVYRQALRNAGLVVLHEVVLHHLIVEMTLARGEVVAYVDTMRRNHGQAGAAWAEGRVAGLHGEIGNFLFPASLEVASSALAVIVHNDYARERLRSFGVGVRIEVVGHPFVERIDATAAADPASIVATRRSLGAGPGDRLAGVFGFV